VFDDVEQQAFRGFAGDDGWSGLAALHQGVVGLEVELALQLLGVVARRAVPREDLVDLPERRRLALLLSAALHHKDTKSTKEEEKNLYGPDHREFRLCVLCDLW
jgi:hypothetical protein